MTLKCPAYWTITRMLNVVLKGTVSINTLRLLCLVHSLESLFVFECVADQLEHKPTWPQSGLLPFSRMRWVQMRTFQTGNHSATQTHGSRCICSTRFFHTQSPCISMLIYQVGHILAPVWTNAAKAGQKHEKDQSLLCCRLRKAHIILLASLVWNRKPPGLKKL